MGAVVGEGEAGAIDPTDGLGLAGATLAGTDASSPGPEAAPIGTLAPGEPDPPPFGRKANAPAATTAMSTTAAMTAARTRGERPEPPLVGAVLRVLAAASGAPPFTGSLATGGTGGSPDGPAFVVGPRMVAAVTATAAGASPAAARRFRSATQAAPSAMVCFG